MKTTKKAISKFKTRADYIGTLRSFTIGETKSFEMQGRVYQGVQSARSLLRKEGWDFDMKPDTDQNIITITRTV